MVNFHSFFNIISWILINFRHFFTHFGQFSNQPSMIFEDYSQNVDHKSRNNVEKSVKIGQKSFKITESWVKIWQKWVKTCRKWMKKITKILKICKNRYFCESFTRLLTIFNDFFNMLGRFFKHFFHTILCIFHKFLSIFHLNFYDF